MCLILGFLEASPGAQSHGPSKPHPGAPGLPGVTSLIIHDPELSCLIPTSSWVPCHHGVTEKGVSRPVPHLSLQ